MGIRESHIQNLESTLVDVKFTLKVNFAIYRTVYFQRQVCSENFEGVSAHTDQFHSFEIYPVVYPDDITLTK